MQVGEIGFTPQAAYSAQDDKRPPIERLYADALYKARLAHSRSNRPGKELGVGRTRSGGRPQLRFDVEADVLRSGPPDQIEHLSECRDTGAISWALFRKAGSISRPGLDFGLRRTSSPLPG